jgi:alanyl-tRNA synthetase
MHSSDVGHRFIRYYQDRGFEALPGGSLLDPSVPMTFVMSAGLTQIESTVDRCEDHTGERYVLLQTCFRHFDLDKVGKSPVHLSLFGMGGAFSFGQTSREDTLGKVWNFLTAELGFRREQLGVTCFTGGQLDGYECEKDVATIRAWHKVGLSPSQIVDVGIDAGFWKQGGGISGKERFRKCGPTTELFFDQGTAWSCGSACQPGCKCGRFIEIANVLFIHSQFDQSTRSFEPLATPFDETVIGVERVAMALQQKHSVFELDCLAPLVKVVRSYHKDSFDSKRWLRSEQVIVDHVRALLFLTADGAPPPGKGGRSGIIRRLIRAVLTHQKTLGITQATFIPDLANAVVDLHSGQYLNLEEGRERLLSYFAAEGERFEQTLSAGYRRLNRIIQQEGNGKISGQQALDLVKRQGIPLLLLETQLAQRGIKLDKQAYCEAYAHWEREEMSTR